MVIDLLPGTDNVVRFPVKLRERPTLDMLRELAPDLGQMPALAEALGVAPPDFRLRDRTDQETARYIAEQLPPYGHERERLLADLESRAITSAVAACRLAHDASVEVLALQNRLDDGDGGGRGSVFHERAATMQWELGRLVLEAHARAEETEGVARAVRLAREGQPWTPPDHETELDILIAAQ
jgi:hypothetical protein